MLFKIISSSQLPKKAFSFSYLVRNPWDDWFEFDTRYELYIFDENGKCHIPGELKIGQKDLIGADKPGKDPAKRSPDLPEEFATLDDNFFSVGQGDDYYATLNLLPVKTKKTVLMALQDCAFNLKIFEKYKKEPVMETSLLRYVTEENIKNRFNRLANGNAILTKYQFNFHLPGQSEESQPVIKFKVVPESIPPSNVHVLIGRNGVGKSRCIQSLTATVLDLPDSEDIRKGRLEKLGHNSNEWSFSGLVHVSFSAFDAFSFPATKNSNQIRGTFVGLADLPLLSIENAKSLKEILANSFVKSFEACKTELRAQRWRSAVNMLYSDPMFEEANILELADQSEDWKEHAIWLFKKLSSGHAIVLLSITRLVELVDEKTLVILDEPEGHLHPPLLSAFIRAVSNLLIERNGVAIVATHSPVVLQEVPTSCVSILNRSGSFSEISQPSLETFGESVGVLTREIFGLEVTNAGFHSLIKKNIKSDTSFETLLQRFENQLGSEAQLIARSLIAIRDKKKKDTE